VGRGALGGAEHGGMKNLKHTLRANRGFLLFLLSFGLFRAAAADWNPIPSASMRPTLLEGDVVLVNRLAYDLKLPLTDVVLLPLAEPQRGDVVTLSSPAGGTRLIKRIVGLPGDRIAMRDDVLILNGQPLGYAGAQTRGETLAPGWVVDAVRATEDLGGRAHAVQFLPGLRARRDFAEVSVPAGEYFLLGDNRDNSEDSRAIGTVPRAQAGQELHRMRAAREADRAGPPRAGVGRLAGRGRLAAGAALGALAHGHPLSAPRRRSVEYADRQLGPDQQEHGHDRSARPPAVAPDGRQARDDLEGPAGHHQQGAEDDEVGEVPADLGGELHRHPGQQEQQRGRPPQGGAPREQGAAGRHMHRTLPASEGPSVASGGEAGACWMKSA
jgi:signal peptidase I